MTSDPGWEDPGVRGVVPHPVVIMRRVTDIDQPSWVRGVKDPKVRGPLGAEPELTGVASALASAFSA